MKNVKLDEAEQVVLDTPAGYLVIQAANGKFFITPPPTTTVEEFPVSAMDATIVLSPPSC